MTVVKNRFLVFILALLFALPFVLCVGGCDDNTANKDPTKEESVSNTYQIVQQNLYDFVNYRADITCQYNCVHTQGDGAGATIDDAADTLNMQLHSSDEGIYFYVQPTDNQQSILQAAFLGEAAFKYNGNKVDMVSPLDFDMTTIVGAGLYYLVQIGFIDFADFAQTLNANALTISNENDEITLTAKIDIKDFVTQLIDNCATNKDEQIIVLLNEFIKDTFNKNTSVQALINGFCANYTSSTTVKDLVDYIQSALGVNLEQFSRYVFELLSVTNGVSIDSDIMDSPIATIVQKDTTGSQLYQNIIEKLSANNLTLANILDGTYTSDNDAVNDILQVVSNVVGEVFDLYEQINVPTAKDMDATWSVVMDKQHVFKGMQLSISGNLGATNTQNSNTANTAVDLKINISFSNIGITDVSYPAKIDNAVLKYKIDLSELDVNATDFEIDLADYPPFNADLEFYADVFDANANTNVSTLIATYNATTKKFVVQTQYLKDKYIAGDDTVSISATDTATSGNYTFKFALSNSAI